MAENDNVPLDTSVFVKQITNVCDKDNCNSSNSSSLNNSSHKNNNSHSSSHALNKMASSGSTERGGATSRCSSVFSSKGGRRHVALLYNSASYESRTTSTAGNSHRHNAAAGRSGQSRSLDDAIVSRHSAWRQQHALSSRQGTCSDEPEEDSELRNASMESLYSSSDRDSDVEAMANTYYEHPVTSSARRARLSRQRPHRDLRRPLLRQALLGSSSCSIGGDVHGYGSCDSSHRNSLAAPVLGAGLLPDHFLPCTASMGDLDKLDTGDASGGNGVIPEVECSHGAAGRDIPATRKRRSISMLNLTPPGRASYYVPDSALPDASPIRPPSSGEMFLDDTLLDGNLADILFSVEALWPKK